MPALSDALALVRDLAAEEPIGHCAEDGYYCVFCRQTPKGAWQEIHHDADCLWVRAVEVVKRLDEGRG